MPELNGKICDQSEEHVRVTTFDTRTHMYYKAPGHVPVTDFNECTYCRAPGYVRVY